MDFFCPVCYETIGRYRIKQRAAISGSISGREEQAEIVSNTENNLDIPAAIVEVWTYLQFETDSKVMRLEPEVSDVDQALGIFSCGHIFHFDCAISSIGLNSENSLHYRFSVTRGGCPYCRNESALFFNPSFFFKQDSLVASQFKKYLFESILQRRVLHQWKLHVKKKRAIRSILQLRDKCDNLFMPQNQLNTMLFVSQAAVPVVVFILVGKSIVDNISAVIRISLSGS
ncbi:E3 ubiquitin protein ligase [Pelagibaculum spongiae]|uniref:Uncharacterized protein n=1 Tax=Pelagibaculum spongiae TaxID=2080658 RepID=A0A2V1GX56_9GAMM|nr:E3 ubiquitin protein ligase [Pelagibaculum spongiae]PVZ65725.1 hypothetical protein DC094_17775 [Pelagibaculum spongiae]